ncbi:MAG: hypothetical protein JNJ54_11535 [Myxococcaceae bacterium]|nr:hypothetical protein [Myxococcaceae bacterium]
MRSLLFLVVVVAQVARAEDFPPPPLVQADVVDPRQGEEIPMPTITNAPLAPGTQTPAPQPLPGRVSGTLAPQAPSQPAQPSYSIPDQPQTAQQPQTPGAVQRAEPPSVNPRILRIGMSALIGAGVGTVTAIAGGFIGGEYLRPGITPIGNIWTGGAIGFAVGAPVGVLLSGLLFRGDAPWYAPILGDLLGAAVGAAAVAFGGPDALSATFALPLLGSIIGYEVGSSDDATVAPSVTMLRGGSGAVVGVSGRF